MNIDNINTINKINDTVTCSDVIKRISQLYLS